MLVWRLLRLFSAVFLALLIDANVYAKTKLLLPNSMVVECEEDLSFDKPQGRHNIDWEAGDSDGEVKLICFDKDEEQTPSEQHPRKNCSGVSFLHVETPNAAKRPLDQTNTGTLDVVLVEGRKKDLLELRTLSLPLSFNAKLLEGNDPASCTCTTPSSQRALRVVSGLKKCVHFRCEGMTRKKFGLNQLTVKTKEGSKVFTPMKLSFDRESDLISVFIVRFKPDNSDFPTELFIQLHDIGKVRENEEVLAELNKLFSDKAPLEGLAKEFLPLKDLTVADALRHKYPWDIPYFEPRRRLIHTAGYCLGLMPWDRGKVFQSYSEIPVGPESEWRLVRYLQQWWIESELKRRLTMISMDETSKWKGGLISGTYYCGDMHVYGYLNDVFSKFSHVNDIQVDTHVSGKIAKGNVGRMILNMLHAPGCYKLVEGEDKPEPRGGNHQDSSEIFDSDSDTDTELGPGVVLTCGGTDSIKTAMHAYRNNAVSRGVKTPVIIMPRSAHPAFTRGCADVEIVKVDIDDEGTCPSYKVKIEEVREALDKYKERVAVIVGSAFNYPHGEMDDIEELSKLALEYEVGLHVDACLGGFILHFLEELYKLQKSPEKYQKWVSANPSDRASIPQIPKIPKWDFRCEGVTSISMDTHKYGNAIKGNSTVSFRTRKLMFKQNFCDLDFQGGIIFTSNQHGSVGVGQYIVPMAALLITGQHRYMEQAGNYFGMTQKVAAAISRHEELEVIGKPYSVVAFKAKDGAGIHVGHVIDYMTLALDENEMDARCEPKTLMQKCCCSRVKPRKWRLNTLQYPDGAHFCMTGPQIRNKGFLDDFSQDLDEAVEYAKRMAAGSQPRQPHALSFYGLSQKGIDLKSKVLQKAFSYASQSFLNSSTETPLEDTLQVFEDEMRHVVGDELGLHLLRGDRTWQKRASPFTTAK
ncbi:hypothetical protein ACWJJH_20025 [Endozoicomonadaceae bacterium StTr2]